MVWRLGGHQFTGATQLLPLGASAEQAEAAIESLEQALKGQLPSSGHHQLKLARDAFAWKDFRVSTKTLLCALANALKQYMPESWTLGHCKPQNLLAPRGPNGERVKYLKEETCVRALGMFADLYFCHDQKTQMRFPDFYLSEDHFRLCFAADEGTEAC